MSQSWGWVPRLSGAGDGMQAGLCPTRSSPAIFPLLQAAAVWFPLPILRLAPVSQQAGMCRYPTVTGHQLGDAVWVPGTQTPTPGMEPPLAWRSSAGSEPCMLLSLGTTRHLFPADLFIALQRFQILHLYAALKEQMEQLKAAKAECTEFENLRQHLPVRSESTGSWQGLFGVGTPGFRGSSFSQPGPRGETPSQHIRLDHVCLGQEGIARILASLWGQVSSVRDLARELQREEEKLSWQQSLSGLRGCQVQFGQGGAAKGLLHQNNTGG